MADTPALPSVCPGVIQRISHGAAAVGQTEWLRVDDPPEWTTTAAEVLVFEDRGAKTGYERACERAEALKAEMGGLIWGVVREVHRPRSAPAMPAGFYHRAVTHRPASPTDWRTKAPNCGVE